MDANPAYMSENNKKILPVINNSSGNIKKSVKSPYQEVKLGCGCDSASCGGCAGSLGMKAGSGKDVVYRNVFSYLMIVSVILLVTYIVKQLLTSMLT
ncbi:hypothetical protein EO98_12320 [Methanosarcina sp. 2.H.T.1A.6]|nr:hypothetical protein EO94_09105 [Methanosarcina sp. 2.H.T.1A.3]KKG23053.1 hypothetical protein EO98_12320 [Methanosarcina sp. 2.H.T.1A.6]KKG24014.1 hypothetical protein EO97_20055 [Methanosarcina sp. 2.H.T.1A.15]KKG26276.1 hypothetical protein EO96_04805 [Methanosarcina sp. 2.H.T.1A.8]